MRARSSLVNGKRRKRIPRRAQKDSRSWRITVRGSPGRSLCRSLSFHSTLFPYRVRSSLYNKFLYNHPTHGLPFVTNCWPWFHTSCHWHGIFTLYHSSIQHAKHVLSWENFPRKIQARSPQSQLSHFVVNYYFLAPSRRTEFKQFNRTRLSMGNSVLKNLNLKKFTSFYTSLILLNKDVLHFPPPNNFSSRKCAAVLRPFVRNCTYKNDL